MLRSSLAVPRTCRQRNQTARSYPSLVLAPRCYPVLLQGHLGFRRQRCQAESDPGHLPGVSRGLVLAVTSDAIPWEQGEVSHLVSQLQTPGLSQTEDELVEQIEQVEANVKSLARFLSPAEMRHVLTLAPQVLVEDLGAWFDFLQQSGFADFQITYMLCQAPQALVKADLITAGHALGTMREAGLDEGTAKALVVNYPQLLHSSRKDIVSMVRTLSRFSTGINC